MRRIIPGVFSILSLLAQSSDLATNHDGSELYFGSRLIHPETSTEPHSKIFRWTRETGVKTFLARKREWITPMPRDGIASNYYDLRYPSLAYDGHLSFSGYRDCRCVSLGPIGTTQATVIDRDGSVTWQMEKNNGSLLPFYAPISPNGKFLIFDRSYNIEYFQASSIEISSLNVRRTVSDDGTTPFGTFDYQLGEIGRLQPDGQRSAKALYRPTSVLPVRPKISGNGKVAVYESLYEQGMPRRFFSLDLATGQERLLFTDAETEDYGPPDFFSDSTLFSFVALPEPMYGASIDYSGRYALVLGREAVDKPRQWLYLAPTDQPEGQGEWFGYVEEGYREAVLSGDAQVVFAVTNSGRLLRIDRATTATEELLTRTPFVERLAGSGHPGALVRLYGGGFATSTVVPDQFPATTSLAGVEIEFQGKPMIITRVSPTEIDFQVPWEFQFQPDSLFEYPLVVKVPNESPLKLAPLKLPLSYYADVLPPGPLREDGTPVTLARRARSHEVLRMVVSGVPQPPGVTGVPDVERKPVDYSCFTTKGPLETLYVGPLPGSIGLSEIVFRLPDLTGAQTDAGRRWTRIWCDSDTAPLLISIPVAQD